MDERACSMCGTERVRCVDEFAGVVTVVWVCLFCQDMELAEEAVEKTSA